jgi:hypothetical protein
VLRNVTAGDDYDPRQFKVFAPVAFALTGELPPDLHSRCVCINLRRKLASEKIEQYRIGQMHRLDVLVRKIVRWTNDNADAIATANPVMPPGVINRSSDLWSVLLSVATVAGADWPRRIEQAITASLELGDDDSELFEKLVHDLPSVFGEKDALSSAELVAALVAMEDRPWPEMPESHKPLSQAKLAALLKGPGVCIIPTQIWFERGGGKMQLRGYTRAQFEDLFARYRPHYSPPDRHSVTESDGTGTSGISQGVTGGVTCDDQGVTATSGVTTDVSGDASQVSCDTPCDTSQSAINPDETGVCDAVTLPRGVGKGTGPLLPGMLEPARVRQLVDWYRKQAKALRDEMSPGSLQAHLKQQLREFLAEELVADLVDDTADRIAKAATPKAKKRRPAP